MVASTESMPMLDPGGSFKRKYCAAASRAWHAIDNRMRTRLERQRVQSQREPVLNLSGATQLVFGAATALQTRFEISCK